MSGVIRRAFVVIWLVPVVLFYGFMSLASEGLGENGLIWYLQQPGGLKPLLIWTGLVWGIYGIGAWIAGGRSD